MKGQYILATAGYANLRYLERCISINCWHVDITFSVGNLLKNTIFIEDNLKNHHKMEFKYK